MTRTGRSPDDFPTEDEIDEQIREGEAALARIHQPEHEREGFACTGCGETFETALGIERHRPRCDDRQPVETSPEHR